jgi:hypothetical protein
VDITNLEIRFQPTSVQISNDDEIIVVGFKDGGLEVYGISEVDFIFKCCDLGF